MKEILQDLGWAAAFVIVGGGLGVALVAAASVFLPRIIGRMTPHIDEGREIARGNRAVADYFGRIVAAAIIGASIVIAAAVLGGLISALH